MKDTGTCLLRGLSIALAALVLGSFGCKSSSNSSMAQQWGDRQLAGRVKKELDKDLNYKYSEVKPIAHEGTVQLTGFVDTPEERQRAAVLASHAPGVVEVINSITIKPTPTGQAQIRQGNTNFPPATTENPGQTPHSNP